MLGHGILIRDLKNEECLGDGYYRIAVKTEAENAEFLRLLMNRAAGSTAGK